MSQDIVTATADGILQIRLNRPQKKNALTREMYGTIEAAFNRANDDRRIKVIWVTGSGDSFSSGNDVGSFLEEATDDRLPDADGFLDALAALEVPLVAAVNGLAVGVGATMLLHCDLVHAAAGATFRFPFVDLGVFPEAASTILLPRLAGHQRAMEMMLLADSFDAPKAHAIGMVNDVFEANVLEEESLRITRRLAAKPAASLRLTKARVKAGYGDLRAVIAEETPLFARASRSPEAREAFNAFLEKRRPDFSQFD